MPGGAKSGIRTAGARFWELGSMRILAPFFGLGLAGLAVGPAAAASPDYCAVYAKEIAKQMLSAEQDALGSGRVHDRLYHKCLNMDEEPAMPAAYAETGRDSPDGARDAGSAASILEDATSETPTVDATAIDEAVVKRTAAIESDKTESSARRKGRWRGSGFVMWSPQWRNWCAEHFPNSFDPKTGTILPYDKADREPCL